MTNIAHELGVLIIFLIIAAILGRGDVAHGLHPFVAGLTTGYASGAIGVVMAHWREPS